MKTEKLTFELKPEGGWENFLNSDSLWEKITAKDHETGWGYINPTNGTFILEHVEYGETIYFEYDAKNQLTLGLITQEKSGSFTFDQFIIELIQLFNLIKTKSTSDTN